MNREVLANDIAWLFAENGEEVLYTPKNTEVDSFSVKAIIDYDAEKPPGYGYEKTLSQRWHEFNFIRQDLNGYEPVRGDTLQKGELTYQIDWVKPNHESEIITVTAQ